MPVCVYQLAWKPLRAQALHKRQPICWGYSTRDLEVHRNPTRSAWLPRIGLVPEVKGRRGFHGRIRIFRSEFVRTNRECYTERSCHIIARISANTTITIFAPKSGVVYPDASRCKNQKANESSHGTSTIVSQSCLLR